MSLLTIVQNACREIGITAPTAVYTNADPQIVQLLALSNREGRTLLRRGRWQGCDQQSTFTTLATEIQGTMASLAGTDFNYILNDTIWNRTLLRPVFGPVSSANWQQMTAQNIAGPFNQFRIRAGSLRFIPSPTAGQTCAFEWMSKNWCQSSLAVGQSSWAADTDTGILDEDLLTLGLIWRWKAAKGFDFGQDFEEYEKQVVNALGRDGGKPRLNFCGTNQDIFPSILVSSGSWSV